MANHIVEYVGREGVITSPLTYTRRRIPRPGDVVLMPDGSYGMVECLEPADRHPSIAGQYHIAQNASAFLCLGQGNTPYVSISGGPFQHVPPARLEQTSEPLYLQRFWNFGDHSAGAGMGVDYYLERPVFRLLPK